MAFTKAISQISPTLVKLGTGSTTPVGGTNDLLTSGNPIKFQPNVSFINIRQHSSAYTKRQGIPARRFWDVTMQAYMQGSGSAGTIAVNGYTAIDALMRSAAINVAAAAGTIVYTPATITVAGTAKCEIWNENHGLLHKAQNCQGNIVWEGVPTDGMKMTYTGRGDYQVPSEASISGFTGGTDRAEAFLNIAGTVTSASGTYAPVISRMSFDRGIQLGQVDDANSSTGLRENFIRDANPTLTMVMAADSDNAATLLYSEWFNDWTNKVTHSVVFTQGTATANRCRFTFPQAQIQRLSKSEGDGYGLVTVEYGITHSTDNTEFQIDIF
jgi:plastocyanin